jgi:hypothetical protein
MSPDQVMKEGNRLIARVQSLNKKEESMKIACQSRSKTVPKNATIRKEFVKCKKPDCCQRNHGPYYYAYWKDPETKRLKKRFIGSHYFPNVEHKENRKEKNSEEC